MDLDWLCFYMYAGEGKNQRKKKNKKNYWLLGFSFSNRVWLISGGEEVSALRMQICFAFFFAQNENAQKLFRSVSK